MKHLLHSLGSISRQSRFDSVSILSRQSVLPILLLFLTLGFGRVWAGETTYTFTAKTWTATSGGSNANWTSGQDGGGFSNNGIQVTTNSSGANGTSPISFTNVTKVECIYNTNKSAGAGSFDVKVGNNSAQNVTCGYSGSSDGRTANFKATVNYATAQTGNVNIKINTTTNSIYLVSVTITTSDGGDTPSKQDLGDDDLKWSADEATVTINGNDNVYPTLTLKQGLSVTYESTATTVAEIGETSGTITLIKAGTTTIKAVFAGDDTYNAKTVSYELTVNAAPLPEIVGGVTDILNSTWSGKSTSSYGNLDKAAPTSEAHYKGNCAGDNSTIQLRSSNSVEGIVSTVSGGTVKRIVITWYSGTADARTLDIYGSNTAYTAASELYSNQTQGTKLGSLNKGNGQTVLDYTAWTGDYKYIGIRSSSGAMYLDEVQIIWLPAPKYEVTFSAGTNCTLDVTKGGNTVSTGAKFEAGTELTVNATASEGYENATISITHTEGGAEAEGVLNGSTLTVPDYDITIAAAASIKNYTVNLGVVGSGTIQIAEQNQTAVNVDHGAEVTLTAVPVGEYKFDHWTISDGASIVITDAEANPATITVTGAGTVTAYFISTAKINPEFAWDVDAVVAVKGQAAPTWPVLSNAQQLTALYSSSNTDVAEIDANGAITVKALGSTNIRAYYVEDDTYAASEASYTLTVKGRVTWHVIKGGVDDAESADYEKEAVPTMPSNPQSCDASISFMGWTDAEYAKSDDAPANLYTENVPAVTDNADYYAVWAVSSADEWSSVALSAVGTNDIIAIVGKSGSTYYGLPNNNGTSSAPGLVTLTISNNKITAGATDALKWKVSGNATNGYTFYPYNSTNTWLYCNTTATSSSNNNMRVGTGTRKVFELDNSNYLKTKDSNTTRYLSIYTDGSDWRGYTNTNLAPAISFYKFIPGSTYDYTTNCIEPLPVLDAPTFTEEDETYYAATTIHLTAADEATIYYTLDGNTPTTTSNVYNNGILLDTRATTTIKAFATKEGYENSEVAEATYTINLPYDCADFAALEKVNGKEYVVRGIISEKGTSLSSGKLPYYISANGQTEGQIKCHNGLKENKAEFTSVDDVNLGDNVTVVGTWSTQYTNLNAGNWMLEYTAREHQSYAIEGALTTTSFNDGEAFDDAIFTNLTVKETFTNGYYENVAGVTFNAGEKTAWAEGDNKLTVNAKLGDNQIATIDFDVIVSSAQLTGIALKADDANYQTKKVYYIGQSFVAPTIIATLDDASSYEATATYVSGFDNENDGLQNVTVSYTRGVVTKTTSYDITMKKVLNNDDDPHTVAVALDLIGEFYATTTSTDSMVVAGIVSKLDDNYYNTYWISDDGTQTNQLEVYAGKYLNNVTFTEANQLHIGDEVVVKGKVKTYKGTKEFDSNSRLVSLSRTPNFSIANVTDFELGSNDQDVTGVTKDGNGDVTLVSSSNEAAVTIVSGRLHAAGVGSATITASLAANGIYKAATTTFTVTVIPQQAHFTLTLNVMGETFQTLDVVEGSAVYAKIANIAAPLADSYVFSGWSTEAGNADEIISATHNINMNANMTLYAIYTSAPYYEKMTSGYVTTGQYLIVYETGNVAFNGGLTTLDASSNTIPVTIANGKIIGTAATLAAEFTICDNGAIMSRSSKYIGVSSNTNALKQTDDANLYTHTFAFDGGNAVIAANFEESNMVLRYNSSSGQTRFRYFGGTQQPIQLYRKKGTEGEVVSIPTVTITENKTSEQVAGENGAAPSLVVESGYKFEVTNSNFKSKKVSLKEDAEFDMGNMSSTTDTLVIRVGAQDPNNRTRRASKVTNANNQNTNGLIFIDYVLWTQAGINIVKEQIGDDNPAHLWYCISAPFDVNMNGGFFWGSGEQMVLNQDFQLFEYDGAKRANTGVTGWKRVSGTMKAGVAYFIGFDDVNPKNQPVIRLKRASMANISESYEMQMQAYAGDEANSNWNGAANPVMNYVGLNQPVQIFDYTSQGYQPLTTAQGLALGTPFFIQSTDLITANPNMPDNTPYYAPQRNDEQYEFCVQVGKAGTTRYDNQMFVRASETAEATYTQGMDMTTSNSTTSKYGALIWTENYNGMRLAIEEAPMNNQTATYTLGVFAPKAGAYRISASSAQENASLYLTYEGQVIWNLSQSAYEADLTKGQNSGYGLLLIAGANQTPTDINEVQGDKLQCSKVLMNGQLYILRDQQMYDLTGKMVK